MYLYKFLFIHKDLIQTDNSVLDILQGEFNIPNTRKVLSPKIEMFLDEDVIVDNSIYDEQVIEHLNLDKIIEGILKNNLAKPEIKKAKQAIQDEISRIIKETLKEKINTLDIEFGKFIDGVDCNTTINDLHCFFNATIKCVDKFPEDIREGLITSSVDGISKLSDDHTMHEQIKKIQELKINQYKQLFEYVKNYIDHSSNFDKVDNSYIKKNISTKISNALNHIRNHYNKECDNITKIKTFRNYLTYRFNEYFTPQGKDWYINSLENRKKKIQLDYDRKLQSEKKYREFQDKLFNEDIKLTVNVLTEHNFLRSGAITLTINQQINLMQQCEEWKKHSPEKAKAFYKIYDIKLLVDRVNKYNEELKDTRDKLSSTKDKSLTKKYLAKLELLNRLKTETYDSIQYGFAIKVIEDEIKDVKGMPEFSEDVIIALVRHYELRYDMQLSEEYNKDEIGALTKYLQDERKHKGIIFKIKEKIQSDMTDLLITTFVNEVTRTVEVNTPLKVRFIEDLNYSYYAKGSSKYKKDDAIIKNRNMFYKLSGEGIDDNDAIYLMSYNYKNPINQNIQYDYPELPEDERTKNFEAFVVVDKDRVNDILSASGDKEWSQTLGTESSMKDEDGKKIKVYPRGNLGISVKPTDVAYSNNKATMLDSYIIGIKDSVIYTAYHNGHGFDNRRETLSVLQYEKRDTKVINDKDNERAKKGIFVTRELPTNPFIVSVIQDKAVAESEKTKQSSVLYVGDKEDLYELYNQLTSKNYLSLK